LGGLVHGEVEDIGGLMSGLTVDDLVQITSAAKQPSSAAVSSFSNEMRLSVVDLFFRNPNCFSERVSFAVRCPTTTSFTSNSISLPVLGEKANRAIIGGGRLVILHVDGRHVGALPIFGNVAGLERFGEEEGKLEVNLILRFL